jgi:hypothetical protein
VDLVSQVLEVVHFTKDKEISMSQVSTHNQWLLIHTVMEKKMINLKLIKTIKTLNTMVGEIKI